MLDIFKYYLIIPFLNPQIEGGNFPFTSSSAEPVTTI